MGKNKPAYGALVEARLAELATKQHGVVSRRQLYDLGCSRGSITRRVEKRRLLRVNRAVYAVGHTRLTAKGRWMAAVLACGRGAVLSHGDAAALHDLRQVGSGAVDVTSPGKHELKGVRCHEAGRLHPDDCTVVDAIPVTDLARTYLDIAELLTHARLIDALEAGQRQNKLDVAALHAAFRALVRDDHLPPPQFNVYVEGELVDAVWREQRLVVEVDGWNFHRTKRSFANDRRRDRKLVKAGWRAVRFTSDEVTYQPEAVAAELSELMRDGPWPPPARSGP